MSFPKENPTFMLISREPFQLIRCVDQRPDYLSTAQSVTCVFSVHLFLWTVFLGGLLCCTVLKGGSLLKALAGPWLLLGLLCCGHSLAAVVRLVASSGCEMP